MKYKIIILLFICTYSYSQDIVTKKITSLPTVTSVGDNTLFISSSISATDKLYKTNASKIKTYIGVNATINDSLDAIRNGLGYYVKNITNSKSAKLINVIDTNSRPIFYVKNDTSVFTNKIKLGAINTATTIGTDVSIISHMNNANAIGIASYGVSAQAGFRGYVAGGTASTPTATQANNVLFFLGGHGYTGSAWTNANVAIRMFSTENFSGTNQGTKMTFETTANGSTTRTERVVIKDTMIVKIPFRSGGTSDYTETETDGTIKMNGQATVWKDLQFHAYRAGGANIPTSTAFIGNIEAYTFAVNDFFYTGPQEIPHDWAEGDTIYFHIHHANTDSITASNKFVKWEIEWAIQNVNGAFYSSTVSSSEITIPQNTRPKTHFVNDIVAILPSTSISKNPNVNLSEGKVGMMVVCRVRRIASAGTSAGTNHYFLQMGIHYKANTIGSRGVYTK